MNLLRRAGGCYRVLVVSTKRLPALPWTITGGDQSYEVALRRAWIIVNALGEQEAAQRAAVIGSQIMGGRPVRIEAIEQKCAPGSHNNEVARRVPFLRFSLVAA